jgi:hypothetical protein
MSGMNQESPMRKHQFFALVTVLLLSVVNLPAQQLRSITGLEAVDGENKVIGPVCADYNGPYAMVCLKSGDVSFRLALGRAGFLVQSETYFSSADCAPPALVPAGAQIYPTANVIGTSVFIENRAAAPQPSAVASKRDFAGNCVAMPSATVDNTRPAIEVPGFTSFAAPFWVREAGNTAALRYQTLVTWATTPPASATYNSTFNIAASTNSGGLISYTVSGGCTVNGAAVTMTSGAESCTVTASVAGTLNHLPASIHATTVALKASGTINVAGFDGVYDGVAHGASGTATGVNGEDLSSLLNLGATFTDPPGGAASWTFGGNANYEAASGTVPVTIAKASTAITWAVPAEIVYGTPLSAIQLNATATQSGTFVYDPPLGSRLKAGNGQVLSVVFVPSDDIRYAGSSTTVLINVRKAPAFVSPNPATKSYGSADPALTGSVSGFLAGDGVTATFSRATGETVAGSPYAITAILNAPSGVLSNYDITYGSSMFSITPRPLTVTANNASRPYGVPNPVFEASFSGFANGETPSSIQGAPTLTTTATPTSLPGIYPIAIAQGSLSSMNYSFVLVGGTLTVTATATAPSSGNTCNGVYNGSFTGDLNITTGQTCIFQGAGGRITGNVQMTGGQLMLLGQQVGGNVQVHNGSTVTINGGSTGGNVQIQNGTSAVDISSVVIGGQLHIQNNTGSVRVFNNRIDKNLHCQNNASITGGGNTAKQKQGQCSAF